MKIETTTMFNVTDFDRLLEKHGLETYSGCSVPLFESVRTEFGDAVATEIIRCIPENVFKEAVCYALTVHCLD